MRRSHQKGIRFTALTGLILMLAVVCAAGPAQAPPGVVPSPAVEIKIGQGYTLHSKILNEDRPYLVCLPQSYANTVFLPNAYPVMYLLDGAAHFHSASGVVQFMSEFNFEIPELIIVAIPNTDRTRDLTPTHSTRGYNGKEVASFASSGGGENFLRFLRDELIPHVEAQYRIAPYRVLVGHSFGGLTAMNALLHRPPIFQGYLAIDPSIWWDDHVLLRRATDAFDKTNNIQGAVFISIANPSAGKDFDPTIQRNTCRDLAALLQAHNSVSFRSTSQFFENEDHASVPLLSLYNGLLFLFDGYKASFTLLADPASVDAHFAKVSQRLGLELPPPEAYVNQRGSFALYDDREPDKAIEWFKLNTAKYPRSYNAWESLATAYETKGDRPRAIANYVKALALNPDDRNAAEHIRRLKPAVNLTGPLTNGIYKIINRHSGKALTVAGASVADLSEIVQSSYTGGKHQQWILTNLGDGYYQVTGAHSGKALDVNMESIAAGASVIQWPYHGGANQVWQVVANGDGTYRLLNEHSRLALEVAHSSRKNGATVDQSNWKAQKNQIWRVKAVSPAAANQGLTPL
jgi:uncharacterized protein